MNEAYSTDRLDKQQSANNAVRMEARLTKLETDREHDRLWFKTLEQRLGEGLDKVRTELHNESQLLRADLTQFRGDCHALRTELGDIRKHMHTHFLWFMGIQATTTFALLGLGAKALHMY